MSSRIEEKEEDAMRISMKWPHRLQENCLDSIDSMVTLRRVVNAVRLFNDISLFILIVSFPFFSFFVISFTHTLHTKQQK